MGFIDQIKRSIEDNGTHAFEEQMYVGQIAKALKDGTVPDVPVSISSERRPDLFFGGNRGVELEYVRYGKQIALISIVDAPEADILYPDALISFFESIAADCGYWALPNWGLISIGRRIHSGRLLTSWAPQRTGTSHSTKTSQTC